jgi:segregation and condensation protein A
LKARWILLLYLIRKQNFNILDIPMLSVTRQYLVYVDQIRNRNLELAAEYLLMAAMLIEIKSRMLLPPKKVAEGQEVEDPRAELVRRLIEYEQMKLAAARLNALPQFGRDFLKAEITIEQSLAPRFPDVNCVICRTPGATFSSGPGWCSTTRSPVKSCRCVNTWAWCSKSCRGGVLCHLKSYLILPAAHAVLVVTFIAMLELAKETLIEITQAEAFAPIYVRLAYSTT